MESVVQLVRMPDCDSGGRGFEPLQTPHKKQKKCIFGKTYFFSKTWILVKGWEGRNGCIKIKLFCDE